MEYNINVSQKHNINRKKYFMYEINLSNPVHVHFIGIGGISMSGIAELLLSNGFTVSGSDNNESQLTRELSDKGADITIGQSADNINDSIDVVVYTAAIGKDNPEYKSAVSKNLPMLSRAEILGEIMKSYASPIAVSGTHGKTTTTSMISTMLLAENTDPTLSIGGILKDIGGNFRVGRSDYFVTEACEYTNSFLSFFPKYSVILNIEEDHLDFFKDINDIRNSFHLFAKLLPEDGGLVINGHIPNACEITEGLTCPVITFGNDSSFDYYPENITFDENAHASFTVHRKGKENVDVTLSVPGEHNILNALAAIALCDLIGVTSKASLSALSLFGGADRRFEYKGKLNGFTIVDDYAHHPTEIATSLSAAAKVNHNRIVCVFQPHTYSRTKSFLKDFAVSLSAADIVILADIYAAREKDNLGISSENLKDEIEKLGTKCFYFPSFEEIEKFILENCKENDLLITMGAGNVVNIADSLLSR